MKKFNFKVLLIFAMVFVMMFALVACGDKKNNDPKPQPEQNQYTPQQFFTNLWDMSKEIGDDEIAANDNIALHLDLALALKLQNSGSVTLHSVDVGIALDVVLDRATADSRNSALKVQLYDPSNNRENWFAGYFFFNDADNIYIDFAGQNIKVPFDYNNDQFAAHFHNLIFNDQLIGNQTLNQLLTQFTSEMGDDWSLDTLIDGVVTMAGLDLRELLGDDLVGTVEGIVGPLFNAQGKLNVSGILTGEQLAGLFTNTKKTTKDGVTTHTTQLDTALFSLVGGLVDGLGNILNNQTIIKLSFDEVDGGLDNFTLSVSLGSITAKDVNNKTVHPVIELTINDLEVERADANEIAIDRTNYTTNVVFGAEIGIALDGITIDPSVFGIELAPIAIEDAELTVGLKGKVDLANSTDNATVANAWIALNGAHIIDASFANGSLGIKIDRTVELDGLSVLDTIVGLWGPQAMGLVNGIFAQNGWDASAVEDFAASFFVAATDQIPAYTAINPEFKGVEWRGIDIVGGFQSILNGLFTPQQPPVEEAEVSAVPTDTALVKVIDTIKKIIPVINTANNKLVISSNDVMGKVVEIAKQFDANFSIENSVDAIIAQDADGWLARIAAFIKVDDADPNATDRDFLVAIFTDLGATITMDLGTNGVDLDLDVTAAGSVGIGVSIHVGASAYNAADFIVITAPQGEAGWIVYNMAE